MNVLALMNTREHGALRLRLVCLVLSGGCGHHYRPFAHPHPAPVAVGLRCFTTPVPAHGYVDSTSTARPRPRLP